MSISNACERLNIDRIDGISATISFRKSEQTIIDNETEIPDEFIAVTMVKKPDKTAIKNAIKSGREIKGAHIETVKNLQIK